jgi:hypothetical protein
MHYSEWKKNRSARKQSRPPEHRHAVGARRDGRIVENGRGLFEFEGRHHSFFKDGKNRQLEAVRHVHVGVASARRENYSVFHGIGADIHGNYFLGGGGSSLALQYPNPIAKRVIIIAAYQHSVYLTKIKCDITEDY